MNIFTKIIWIFFFVYCLPAQGIAQVYDIKKLSTNEGLPSGQIGYVQQDSTGYMWLSTFDGLIRYNGYETKAYTIKNGLRSDIVNAIFVDDENKLWLATEESGVGYLQKDSVYYPADFAILDTVSVMYITESMDRKMYFPTYGDGLFIWDGESFEHITTKDGLPSDIIWELHFRDTENEIWMATQEGVAILDTETKEIKEIITIENGLSGRSAYSFAEERDGTIWVSTSDGASIFDGTNWSHLKSINGTNLRYVYDVLVDKTGLVWIGTESNGLYWFDGDNYTHIKKENGLSSNYIYSLYEDSSGRVWISTDENGVNIFRNQSFKIYSDFAKNSGGASVNIIHDGGDELWLGTENGLTLFSENGDSKHIMLPDRLVDYKEVWDIAELDNGNLLVLNSFSKILEFDGQRFSDYGETINLPFLYINDIHLQSEILWMTTEMGVAKYEDGEYTYYTTEQGLKDDYVWSLYEDQENEMWAVTDQGVSRLDTDTVFTISFEDGISGSSMSLMTQSPNGKYYVGTDMGFSEVELEGSEIVQTRNFSVNPVFLREPMFLMFDEDENLWKGTNGGIHFFEAEQISQHKSGFLEGSFFPLQDYGKGIEFNFLSALRKDDGDLWFGSYTHGLIKYEGGIPVKKQPPKAFLRSLYVNGEEFISSSSNKLELDHDQHHISFKIGGFHYEDPQRIFYEYRLSGSEEEWAQAFNKSELNYTHLPPGDYRFEVKTKSIQSDWSEPVTLIEFKINKPFWNQTWFYVMLSLILIGGIYGGFKIFLVYYEKQKLDELVEQKTEELKGALAEKDVLIKEIHHRVKNNMAVVSGLLDLQAWKMNDGEAKMALENSKMRIQTMASIHEKLYQNDNLAYIEFDKFATDLVSKITGSLKAVNRNITVSVDVEPVNINVNLAIPCGLILNEAVSNSFEHAFKNQKNGSIEIVFKSFNKDSYLLVIKDDGVGIPEALKNGRDTSLGITLMRSLATQIKADLCFENNSGTTLRCIIPK